MLRKGWVLLLFLSLSALFAAPPTQAQSTPADSTERQRTPIIERVRFRGNTFFTRDQLEARVRTNANRRFLRIPGFTWWLWLHQLGESGLFGERIGRALIATGEPPAVLDSTLLAQDVERLQAAYHQIGFPKARVEAEVDTLKGNRLDVYFDVNQGAASYIRTVLYDVEELLPEQQMRLTEASLLQPAAINPDAPLTFRAQGQRFDQPLLQEERRRILAYLQDEGYAAVSRDSIRAIIYPLTGDSVDIHFQIRPGARYRFKDIHFAVSGPEDQAEIVVDTLGTGAADEQAGTVTARISGDSRFHSSLLERTLQFRPGAWYSRSQVLSTKRRLEATGVFSFTRIDPLFDDTLRADVLSLSLPHRITLQTKERHQMRFEALMLLRNGVLTTAENELGTGLGVVYENANMLGGGETFRFSPSASMAADVGSRVFTSIQVEVASSLTYPYLIRPFGFLDRSFDLYDARTQMSLSFLTARRDELRLIIRARGNARLRLEMQHSPTRSSLLDVVDVSVSNPDTLQGFREQFLEGVFESVTDPTRRGQIEEDYTRPQVNTALRYTFRSARVNALRRESGYSYEFAFEVGSNLPYLLDQFVFTPGVAEGSIPGISLFRGRNSANELLYRQYVRGRIDLRQYKPISTGSVFAWKVIAGIALPTGNQKLVPFDRRFYSGGASSVRGWDLRELGPGASSNEEDSRQFFLGGDVKLETSVELRNTMMRDVLAADWILTFFGDAGNVWLGPRNETAQELGGVFKLESFYKELGVGGGLGLRLAWEYLIVRLDLAYQLHNPALEGQIFEQPFSKPRLHFGIGHAF